MCVAIPGEIVSIEGTTAVANFGGVARRVELDLVPESRIGDYILVHAGFAMKILDPTEYKEIKETFEELDAALARAENP